ncbi:MAG: hypothetical protein HN948_07430, partial [Clostridia bacterium]|nr:hypothetical protein [Clostridia bacterium]
MFNYTINQCANQQAQSRLSKAYRCEQTDRVPVVELAKEDLHYTIKQIALDKECMLTQQLRNITLTSRLDTDYAPYLEPWICVPIHVEPFGAKIKFMENEWPSAYPVITDNPQDVYKLKCKPVWQSDLWKRLRGIIDFFQANTRGDIPIALTDPQGPFTNASLLWQTDEFFTACYTHPKQVHHIMNILTDSFIEYTDAQLKLIDNPAFPGHSFPLGETGRGISLSDDNSVMISPAMFEEFNLPYLNRISEHYNGIYYHSCGNYMKVLPSIMKIKKLRAVNYHTGPYEMVSRQARKIINGKCAVWSSYSIESVGWRGNMPPIETVFKDYYIPQNLEHGKRGIILAGMGSYQG